MIRREEEVKHKDINHLKSTGLNQNNTDVIKEIPEMKGLKIQVNMKMNPAIILKKGKIQSTYHLNHRRNMNNMRIRIRRR